MRILVVTSSYPRSEGDFAGRFVFDLNSTWVAAGHRVTILAPTAGRVDDASLARGGRILRIDAAGELFYGDGMDAGALRRGWIPTLALLRRAAPVWRAEIARAARDADLVIAHWLYPAGLWTISALRAAPLPVLVVAHGGDVHLIARPVLGRGLAHGLRRRSVRMVATSVAAARLVSTRLRLAGSEMLVSPMGVDARVFEPPSPGNPRLRGIVGAGRLVPIKGFDVLVRACARLGVPLTIAGDGPERGPLAQLARTLGVDLTLPGVLTPGALADLFRGASVVVVPSRRLRSGRVEGCPVVALEALSSGAPVIGTTTGGLPDVLAPHALVPPEDPDSLAMTIAAALAEPDRWVVADAGRRYGVMGVAARILAHALGGPSSL